MVAIEHDKLDLLILIRLSQLPRRPTASALRKPLERYLSAAVPRAQLAALFDERLEALRHAGLVEDGGFALTDAGRSRVRTAIGTDRLAWRSAGPAIAALALGLDPRDTRVRKRLRSAEGVAAAVLSQEHDLAASEERAPTLSEAVDRLAWRLLTGEAGKLTLNGARLHLLSGALGGPARGSVERAARRLAAKELGAGGTEAAHLAESLARRWLAASADDPAPSEPAHAADPTAEIDGSLAGFARCVNQAAQRARDGRWGERKVFISAVWRTLAGDPVVASLDLAGFKHRLCEANHAGLLALHRADLVGAMNPRELAESEARYMNATFHFIEAPGALSL